MSPVPPMMTSFMIDVLFRADSDRTGAEHDLRRINRHDCHTHVRAVRRGHLKSGHELLCVSRNLTVRAGLARTRLTSNARRVAHDRRGHGRSSQAWSGNDMDGYADDLAALIDALDLREIIMVGHSTGGGEVARYIGRYGTKRLVKAVLIAAVPPLMLKSSANPEGLPIELFDNLRNAVVKDRSQAYEDFAPMFYRANRPGAKVSQGTLDQFWLWSMQAASRRLMPIRSTAISWHSSAASGASRD